ncbi:MAG: PEP/pyruvate-binding domain-containing protein [Candidatus Neomarinimicrobiota bacterium]|nr:PEP/pyruvate-binding domain-containing protein [Candidatus Neomarinimicrobiota bacterium]|tara:strand:+ start:8412 stop:11405 length:2994 start_codon:yes stop_codon:yes gene_type:complete
MKTVQFTHADKLTLQDLIFHRIHEILLVASPYDSFVLEEDGRLTEQILHEYMGMNFSNAPRVWQSSTAADALTMLSRQDFDLIVVMMRIADMDPILFCSKIKELYPQKPVVLLAFDESEIKQLPEKFEKSSIDNIFIWSGNANVLLAIVKLLEDKMNIKRDIKKADVRCIILIEDSPRYYSLILPMIYKEISHQVKEMVDKSASDHERLLYMRGRPKILLARSYEEAERYFKRFRMSTLGIISDIRFPKKGKLDKNAGAKFARWARSIDPSIPIMLQSKHNKNANLAKEVQAHFLYKDSPTLLRELRDFLVSNFGFGDLVFRTPKGKEIIRVSDLNGLINAINTVPEESLLFHAKSNHFSNWLAAHGYLGLASKVRPINYADFKDSLEHRNYLIELINNTIQNRKTRQVVEMQRDKFDHSKRFIQISGGSLGGKARGLAFAQKMIRSSNLRKRYPEVNINIPHVAVIGTDSFDQFMRENNLWNNALSDKSNKQINNLFIKSSFNKSLMESLKLFIKSVKYPLAVRSSSLLEDSQYQPLSGMYATYMLPNNQSKVNERLDDLVTAIKLVYASTFYQDPKSLISRSVHRIEEEKMAVILMEMVGQNYNDRYYPTFSGTAQSFNFYPISYMKRNDGVAHLALGLGRTIANGEKSLRFSPKYPGILPQYYSIKATIESSQNSFYAMRLNGKNSSSLKNEDKNLSSFSLKIAEKDGSLKWSGSVVSNEDNIIRDTLAQNGTRVITFTPILKWSMFPLVDILNDLLEMGKDSLGCEVEIEFAVNIFEDENKSPEFSLLQIKPMVMGGSRELINMDNESSKSILCNSKVTLGDGFIDNVQHIVFVDPKKFRAANTKTIAKEIHQINNAMLNKSPYILVGPGRWGSADPWLGIPVNWEHISGASAIVEIGINDFPVDPSFGSHFFQNVTSMRLGYFTIDNDSKEESFDHNWLKKQKIIKNKKFTACYELERPLRIKIDGQTGNGIILKPNEIDIEPMDEQETSGI